jgi:sugar lactone lactonase YvrE
LDNSPINGKIDAAEIQDIRVVNNSGWPREIGIAPTDEGGLGRALCFDLDGNLWVGLNTKQKYYKVSPVDGSVLAGPIATPGHTPYGCAVDSQGRLWSASSGTTLAEIADTRNPTSPAIIHDHSANGFNYGISLRRGCGGEETRVYLSELFGKTYIEFNPATGQFTNTSSPEATLQSYAIGVDLNGDIVSGYRNGRVVKYSPLGTAVWDTNVLPAGPTKPSGDLHGLIIDAHNDVWAVLRNENQVVKYSGLDGHQIAVVNVGAEPYTYGNVQPPNCPSPDIDVSLVTGWDENSSTRLSRGSADDDWTVTVGGGSTQPAVLVSQPPPAWPRFRPSEWLSANTSGASQPGAATMRFERCFCLASDATNAKLTMRLWADDQATVLLNGAAITGPGGQFRRVQPLSVLYMGTVGSSLFQAGNNCVAVVVEDIRQLLVGVDVAGSVWVDQGKCDGASY